MPEHPKIELHKIIPRASPEAIRLMEWMLAYNPKKRPKPAQLLSHEFFHPKTSLTQISPKLSTHQQSSHDTTAESKSVVESIIIGNSQIQIKSKILNNQEQEAVRNQTNTIMAANNVQFDMKRSSPELSIVPEGSQMQL